MRSLLFRSILVVAIAASPMVATATVLQFEGIAPVGFEITWSNAGIVTYTEAGFDMTTNQTSQAFFLDGSHPGDGLSGTTGDTLFYQNSTNLFTLARTSGGIFDLVSVDAGGVFSGSGDVQITGSLFAGGSVTQTFSLANATGTGVLPTLNFGGVFNGLASVNFTRLNGNFIAFDNLTLSDANVPEPTTLALLGLGLAGLGFRNRKKKLN